MRVIGIISGTSVDGIDAVIVDIPEDIEQCDQEGVKVLGFSTYPYPEGIRERVLEVSAFGGGSVEKICHLNAYIGELFAKAVLQLVRDTGISIESIDIIGSHGQTIQHLPHPIHEDGVRVTSTLQLGEPSIIAERTGVTTIADFRPRDMAAGGEGAPFAPYAHYVLFRHPEKARIVVNIGGISNLTYLPAGATAEQVIAFDTGPGNMIIDQLITRFTDGTMHYDQEGRLAAQGTCHEALLDWMLQHPYLQRTPPKSTGREEFGRSFVNRLLQRSQGFDLSEADLVATATRFTVETIVKSCTSFCRLSEQTRPDMFLCGGGLKNRTLVNVLQAQWRSQQVFSVEELGVSSDALEAITFALLARATMLGKSSNLPGVTGASSPVILGKIVPGRRYNGIKVNGEG